MSMTVAKDLGAATKGEKTPPERDTKLAPSAPQIATNHTAGKIVIAEEVVSTIARLAAEEVPGIHQIGSSSLRKMLGGRRGVVAEVGMAQAAIDLDIVIEYGAAIPEVAQMLQQNIVQAVEGMTGRQVVEVNITVVDVHLPKKTTSPSIQGRQLA
jgi:uncharacterized alkaline shock family protein YloU